MNIGFVAIIFEIENQFQRMGYLSLIKAKHPETDVFIITHMQYSGMARFIKCCYIISDYMHYTTKCICSLSGGNIFFIIDEYRRNITLADNTVLNKNTHDWALRRASLRRPPCLHCKIVGEFTLLEFAMISAINSLSVNETDVKSKVVLCLNINRSIYSRLMRSLLLRLGLKREHSLIQWAYLHSPCDYQDGLQNEN